MSGTKGSSNLLLIFVSAFMFGVGAFILGRNSVQKVSKIDELSTNQSVYLSAQPLASSQIQVSPSVVPIATINPTPTPIPYLLQSAVSDNIYINNVYSFSMHLPKSLFFYNSQTAVDNTSFLENQDGTNAVRFGFEIVKENRTLEEIAKSRGLNQHIGLEYNLEKATLSGFEAIFVTADKSMRELCNYNSDEKKRRVVAFLIRNKSYTLILTSNDTCKTFQNNWFEPIATSVSFF